MKKKKWGYFYTQNQQIKKVSRAFLNFEEAANTLKVTSKSSD